MNQILTIRKAAQEFRRFAQATEFPAYAAMMQRAAEDLEQRLAELTVCAQTESNARTS